MADKQFKIYDILMTCAEFIDEPSNEEKTQAFNELKKDLVIRSYMPLRQKGLCLEKAIVDLHGDIEEPYMYSVAYEIAFLFDCVLAYVVNLDPDINILFKTPETADMLYNAGLIDYILGFCQKDVDALRRMADRMISFDNLKEISDAIDLTSPEQIQRLTDEFKKFADEMDPQKLKGIAQMINMNDPLLKDIKDTIEDKAYIEANK